MNTRLVLPVLLLAPIAALPAQTTTASTTIGPGGVGCQGPTGILSGGAVGSATVTVTYDSSTFVLQVVVDNTTPVVGGEATAVITDVYLNLPPGAITSAALVGQTGSGGATPAFSLTFDADTLVPRNPISIGCFGKFNLCLENPVGVQGAIANPLGTTIATNPVIGPVTFTLQLGGPGAGGISAQSILASHSQLTPQYQANAMVKFQSAGIGGLESGFVGSGGGCQTAVYSVGNPTIGQTIQVCVTGDRNCHVCLWASQVPGPVTVAGFTLPIGLPLLAVFDFGELSVGGFGPSICISVNIPNVPSLVGATIYFTNLTFPGGQPQLWSFAPAFTLIVQ